MFCECEQLCFSFVSRSRFASLVILTIRQNAKNVLSKLIDTQSTHIIMIDKHRRHNIDEPGFGPRCAQCVAAPRPSSTPYDRSIAIERSSERALSRRRNRFVLFRFSLSLFSTTRSVFCLLCRLSMFETNLRSIVASALSRTDRCVR